MIKIIRWHSPSIGTNACYRLDDESDAIKFFKELLEAGHQHDEFSIDHIWESEWEALDDRPDPNAN